MVMDSGKERHMGSVRAADIPQEQRMANECWEFYKRNYIPEDGDQYWENLVTEAKGIGKKYNSHPLAVKHLMGYMDIIEKRYEQMVKKRTEGDTQG